MYLPVAPVNKASKPTQLCPCLIWVHDPECICVSYNGLVPCCGSISCLYLTCDRIGSSNHHWLESRLNSGWMVKQKLGTRSTVWQPLRLHLFANCKWVSQQLPRWVHVTSQSGPVVSQSSRFSLVKRCPLHAYWHRHPDGCNYFVTLHTSIDSWSWSVTLCCHREEAPDRSLWLVSEAYMTFRQVLSSQSKLLKHIPRFPPFTHLLLLLSVLGLGMN